MSRKNAWVVGGTSGIGLATAAILKKRGRSVLATGQEDDVREWSELEWIYTDVILPNLGDLHELVYCAGVNDLVWLGKMGPDYDYTGLLDVNVAGFVRLCDILADYSVENLRVVVVGSDAAERPMRTSMLYCASKAALHMAAQVAAREMAAVGWRVNVVAPGMTSDTNMTKYIDDTVPDLRGWSRKDAELYEQSQLVVKRRATPEEIAEVIETTLDGPDYLNSAIINVNGGR